MLHEERGGGMMNGERECCMKEVNKRIERRVVEIVKISEIYGEVMGMEKK